MKSHLLPQVERASDRYLGGLITLFILLSIILLFAVILSSAHQIHSYALQKSEAITVSLENIMLNQSKPEKTETIIPIKKQEPQPEKTKEISSPKDISSLFSSVETKKITHTQKDVVPQKVDNKRLSSLQTRLKTTKNRKSTLTSQKVKQMDLVKPSHKSGSKGGSSGEEVDKYRASIQATIYNYFYPPQGSEGLNAKIQITISASGKMLEFKILRYSGDSNFDREIEDLKHRLSSITFAKNPDATSAQLDVHLISKE